MKIKLSKAAAKFLKKLDSSNQKAVIAKMGTLKICLAEVIEDMAMERAIEEGKDTEFVSRNTIFQLLEPKA